MILPSQKGKTPPDIQDPCSYGWSQFLRHLHHFPAGVDVLQDAAIEGPAVPQAILKPRLMPKFSRVDS